MVSLPEIWYSADPGVEYLAWVSWFRSNLVAAGITPGLYCPTGPRDLLVIEKPQIWREHGARDADIIDLAISAGQASGQFHTTVWYLAAEWKGQIPKKVHHPRILARLTDFERTLLPKKKMDLKHILDAVGLGLYHMDQIGVTRDAT